MRYIYQPEQAAMLHAEKAKARAEWKRSQRTTAKRPQRRYADEGNDPDED
jgi:hypothetical protein